MFDNISAIWAHTHRCGTSEEQRKHLGKLWTRQKQPTHQESFLCNTSPVLCSAKLLNERIWNVCTCDVAFTSPDAGGIKAHVHRQAHPYTRTDVHPRVHVHMHTNTGTQHTQSKNEKQAKANFSPEPPAVAMESCHIALPRR